MRVGYWKKDKASLQEELKVITSDEEMEKAWEAVQMHYQRPFDKKRAAQKKIL